MQHPSCIKIETILDQLLQGWGDRGTNQGKNNDGENEEDMIHRIRVA